MATAEHRFLVCRFDERRGVIQNKLGRVVEYGEAIPGVYVTGWIKRGCRGIIGSNKKCARETIECLFDDMSAGRLNTRSRDGYDAMTALKAESQIPVFLNNWLAIDHAERDAGRRQHRPRVKMTNTGKLLACALSAR